MFNRTLTNAPRLNPSEVHIWLSSVDSTLANPIGMSVLSYDELKSIEAMGSVRHQERFAAGRIFMRKICALYLNRAADSLRFVKGYNGKVELADDHDQSIFHVSLSHCQGQIALALARVPLGIDIEMSGRRCDIFTVAKRFFTPREFSETCGSNAAERVRRFFFSWTLKEAYIKATGDGFRIKLDDIGFSANVMDCINVEPLPDKMVDGRCWSFAHLELPNMIFLGLCGALPSLSVRSVRIHRLEADRHADRVRVLRYYKSQPFHKQNVT